MGFQNFDIVWEMVIQRRDESFQWMFGRGEEVDHLALGMGSRVRAACAPDPGRLTGELGEPFLQLSLDGRMSNLQLKSSVAGALVFNQKGYSSELPIRSVI